MEAPGGGPPLVPFMGRTKTEGGKGKARRGQRRAGYGE